MAMKRVKKSRDELSPLNLPNKLMINILSRLPVKSIVRFKCVSKSWSAMFAHPQFVKLHLTRSRQFKLVLSRSWNNSSRGLPMGSLFVLSCGCFNEATTANDEDREGGEIDIFISDDMFDSLEEREQVSIVGSCRGLVLCYATMCLANPSTTKTLYLVNPSTREVFTLPDSPLNKTTTHFAWRGLGYDASVDDYKVVQISTSSSSSGENIMILYSLKSNSWRRVGDVPSLMKIKFYDSGGLFLNGNLHWYIQHTIISFSLAEEKFGYVPLPDDDVLAQPFIRGSFGIVRGCLCLLYQVSLRITCWVMKKYGSRESWTKFEFAGTDSYNCQWKPLNFSNNDEDLFSFGRTEFAMCNLKEKTHRFVDLDKIPEFCDQIVTCLESLVSPKSILQ